MLKNMITRALLTACAILACAALPLAAQGVSRQDYSGLDKYLEQGRMSNSTFVGVRAAEFLTIPVGARGIGMGNAYSAVVEDITATWWNPAGLGFLNQNEVTLTVVDYTLDLTYSYGAAAFPLMDGNLVVGGFFGYLDIPEMEITTISQPEGTGDYFRAYDFQMGGAFAYNFSDRFLAGLSLKYVHQDMWSNIGASAFAIDAGAIYHTDLLDREIKFAFTIQNLGTNLTMRGPNLVEEVEIARPSYIPIAYAAGTELTYNFNQAYSAAGRMGWMIQTDEFTDETDQFGYEYYGDDPLFRGISFGMGFQRNFGGKVLMFDYAYRNKGRLSADNFFSVSLGF